MSMKGRRIGILGLGEAGIAAAKWLSQQGAEILTIDDFKKGTLEGYFQIVKGEEVTEKLLRELDVLVVSPGINPGHQVIKNARAKNIPILGELYLAACFWPGTLVGITGTNGKTSTTMLTNHLLRNSGIESFCAGNISPPLFDVLSRGSESSCAVVEISSFQLAYFPSMQISWLTKPKFKAAVVLNIAPDHLDWHKGLSHYASSKLKIFSYQNQDDFAIIGPGITDEFKEFLGDVKGRRFLIEEIVSEITNDVLRISIFDVEEHYDLRPWLKEHSGKHNLENLTAAIISARAVGAEPDKISKAYAGFKLPSHRQQLLGVIDGISFVDDSKATNIHALKTALEQINGGVVLIAGGRGKGEDYQELARFIVKLNGKGPKINACVLIGEEGPLMAKDLKGVVPKVFVISGKEGDKVMKEAVEISFSAASSGDTILLSPGCASFDLFGSYAERGEAFKQAYEAIRQGR